MRVNFIFVLHTHKKKVMYVLWGVWSAGVVFFFFFSLYGMILSFLFSWFLCSLGLLLCQLVICACFISDACNNFKCSYALLLLVTLTRLSFHSFILVAHQIQKPVVTFLISSTLTFFMHCYLLTWCNSAIKWTHIFSECSSMNGCQHCTIIHKILSEFI